VSILIGARRWGKTAYGRERWPGVSSRDCAQTLYRKVDGKTRIFGEGMAVRSALPSGRTGLAERIQEETGGNGVNRDSDKLRRVIGAEADGTPFSGFAMGLANVASCCTCASVVSVSSCSTELRRPMPARRANGRRSSRGWLRRRARAGGRNRSAAINPTSAGRFRPGRNGGSRERCPGSR
jgi:hypothetical protein